MLWLDFNGAGRVLILAAGVRCSPHLRKGVESTTAVGKHALRSTEMTDLHTKGASNKAKGQVEEWVGKLRGNRHQEAKGKAAQVQGSIQQGLGDVQDAVRRP